jgi:hypothetical protein
MGLVSLLLLASGCALPSYHVHAASDYQNGYWLAYSDWYDKGKDQGIQDAKDGKSDMGQYWASATNKECKKTTMEDWSSNYKQGVCDGITYGLYNGYNAGYTSQSSATSGTGG